MDRVILKELKTVKEQLDTCPESREDLKAEYQARYDVIAKYAPKQMDAAEVKAYLEEKFADVIATKNKGQIMKAVMADVDADVDAIVAGLKAADFYMIKWLVFLQIRYSQSQIVAKSCVDGFWSKIRDCS